MESVAVGTIVFVQCRNCGLKKGTHMELIMNFSIKDSETVVIFQEYDKDSVQSFFD
jgi:hypothetical protein